MGYEVVTAMRLTGLGGFRCRLEGDVDSVTTRAEVAMKAEVERELKLEGEGVDLDRLGGDAIESHVFSSVYHDAPDLRLLRAGVTLRRRTENGASVWQLKLPHADARLELEEAGGPASVPASLAAVLSGLLRGQEVVPIAMLATRRSGRAVEGVEVTMDEVEVLEDDLVVRRFTEVEAELVDGPVEALDRVGRELQKLGARKGKATPRILRAVDVPERRGAGATATALEALQVMVGAQYDELLRYDPIVRVSDDAESVHKMRVAVRRLRSVLRSARPMLDKPWVRSLRNELDWLADGLGAVRDLDVLLANLGADAEKLSGTHPARTAELLHPLAEERTRAREELRERLAQARYYRLLDTVEGAASAPPTRRDDVSVEKFARKDFRRLRRSARRLASQTDVELHKTRIRGKRARYAAELAERSRGKKASRFIKAAKDFQDVLGDHQDAVVAGERLHDLALRARSTEAALLAGRLIERQGTHRRDARRNLAAVWRKLERRGKRAWLS
jgi:CHAD domain-containing protein